MTGKYYNFVSCKTCTWWEPFNEVCTNGDSPKRGDFVSSDSLCGFHEMNRHFCCGGVLEGRVNGTTVEHNCYGCMFTVLIDGKPIKEKREHLIRGKKNE